MTHLLDFYEMLKTHDFDYESTDDHGYWKRENDKRRILERIAGESVKHLRLFDDFYDYYKAPLSDREKMQPPEKPRAHNAPISLRS